MNDEELLKKENISLEKSKEEHENKSQIIIDLKTKIEKEITDIDKLYENINQKVTQSYVLKHEKLTLKKYTLKYVIIEKWIYKNISLSRLQYRIFKK